MDNELTSGQRGREELVRGLQSLRAAAVRENEAAAAALGIASAAAVTCVKPSGTVSQLVDAASGIHPRHSRFYIRRVRGTDADPLTRFLALSGVPHEPCAYTPGSTVRSRRL
jgi:ribonucleoside-triphosphate reductase (thioredoxin)